MTCAVRRIASSRTSGSSCRSASSAPPKRRYGRYAVSAWASILKTFSGGRRSSASRTLSGRSPGSGYGMRAISASAGEAEAGAAELEVVAGAQRGPLDAPAVDARAVGRAEVVERPGLVAADEQCVAARHGRVADDEVAAPRAAEEHRAGVAGRERRRGERDRGRGGRHEPTGEGRTERHRVRHGGSVAREGLGRKGALPLLGDP